MSNNLNINLKYIDSFSGFYFLLLEGQFEFINQLKKLIELNKEIDMKYSNKDNYLKIINKINHNILKKYKTIYISFLLKLKFNSIDFDTLMSEISYLKTMLLKSELLLDKAMLKIILNIEKLFLNLAPNNKEIIQ